MLPPGRRRGRPSPRGAPGWEFQLGVRHGFDLAPGNGVAPPRPAHPRWRTSTACRRTSRAGTRARAPAAARSAPTIRGWCERFARDHAARLTPLAPTLPALPLQRLAAVVRGPARPRSSRGPARSTSARGASAFEFQRVVVGVAAMPRARAVVRLARRSDRHHRRRRGVISAACGGAPARDRRRGRRRACDRASRRRCRELRRGLGAMAAGGPHHRLDVLALDRGQRAVIIGAPRRRPRRR
jgi:hypothetical protein